ncbi:MAG: preprotein translocase subunit SecA [Flavobacteriales bacterium]|jgi:preprotein translocase subunit SecA|nr:preprotein translocase subunit SecA [Flavobacteriales bacterium]
MISGLLKKIFGDKSQKDIKALQPYVDQINEVFQQLKGISDDELRAKTIAFKTKISEYTAQTQTQIKELKEQAKSHTISIHDKEGLFNKIEELEKEDDELLEEVLLEILPEAFAVVKETSRRLAENKKLVVTANENDKKIAANNDYVEIEGDKAIWHNEWDAAGTQVVWNMVHYDVQLMGGSALHQGKIAEMQTGEGKTLVSTLPVYLNALAGKGVHVVTVNDYLARRDAQWMGPLYEFHGMRVDCIDNHQPHSEGRINAYKADITFGTNNEFGFDYLRDNMVSSPEEIVQQKHHFAIIDEVDSVLVDDARTPLIISGPTARGGQQEFVELKPQIERLVTAQRKLITSLLSEAKTKLTKAEKSQDKKEIKALQEEGGLALLRSYRGLPKNKPLIKYLSEPGIKVQLQKVENFYMQDNNKEMPKADEVLYFVIDEKSNTIDLTEKGIDLISGKDNPNFYVLPDIGEQTVEIENSEKSDEEKLAAKDAMMRDYTVKAERIHSMNQLLKAYTLFEKEVEYIVQENKVKLVDEQTGRVMDGRRYSDGLHQAIEAKENVKVEAASQTYATITLQNFFRMYHKLAGMTGTAETEASELWDIYKLDVVVVPTNKPIARKDKEDLVYKTAREKYNGIIAEVERLRNSGRPVLVGTTTVEISELLSKMLNMRKIPHQVLNAKLHQSEAEVVAKAGQPGTVTIATNMAGRGTDIKLGEGVKEAGGLAIIGTERHDSRRVDRQLRGRAGRQGDPGSSQFFVSLEDNLMRMFGSERIAKMMDRMGHKEGEVIQAGMITKSIERAQKKVEENNFGIRKRLLEFDDVMNAQRTAIYSRRKNALFGDKLDLDLDNIFDELAEQLVKEYKKSNDFEAFNLGVITTFGMEVPVEENEAMSMDFNALTDAVYHKAVETYQRKVKTNLAKIEPVVKKVFEEQGENFETIQVPFTDGKKMINLTTALKEANDTDGVSVVKTLEKRITLALIDDEWKEHLREMDDLKQSVYHAQYEQKDPLLIYKLEGYDLFINMMNGLNKEIVSFLIKAEIPVQGNAPVQTPKANLQPAPTPDLSQVRTNKEDVGEATEQNRQAAQNSGGQRPKPQPVVSTKKYGRNDRVKVLNLRSGETQEMKFKQAEALITSGSWQLVD